VGPLVLPIPAKHSRGRAKNPAKCESRVCDGAATEHEKDDEKGEDKKERIVELHQCSDPL
jgi:hypothetical protein